MSFVTIDFDICLWQDINIYNNAVGTFKSIDSLIKENPILDYVRFDATLYCRLTEFIVKVARKLPANKIHFITSHEEIVPLIKTETKENQMINIDNHHDIQYGSYVEHIDYPQCGSWVKYLYQQNKIDSYIHVGTDNSDRPFDEDMSLLTDFFNVHRYDFNLLVEDTEELFICLSPGWVPAKYHDLFKAWAVALSAMKNCKYTY